MKKRVKAILGILSRLDTEFDRALAAKPYEPSRVIAVRRRMAWWRDRLRNAEGHCSVRVWHGPGHQSHTYCDKTGPHRIHHAIYGEFDNEIEWRGERGKVKCAPYWG